MSHKNNNQDDISSSRRSLLKGVGLLGGAFALGGAATAQAEKAPGEKKNTRQAPFPPMNVGASNRIMANIRRGF